MYELKLYYSIQNGGDGSAYPQLMESKELCELDQDLMDEGWGETCAGSFTVESESPITIKNEVVTAEMYIKKIEEQLTYCSSSNRKNLEDKITAVKQLIENRK